MIWDFSKAGLVDALKEFFVSLIKTMLVAGGAYVAVRLDNLHPDLKSQVGMLFFGLIVVGRSLVSSFVLWVETPATPKMVASTDNASGL